jgi:hypothetical protein
VTLLGNSGVSAGLNAWRSCAASQPNDLLPFRPNQSVLVWLEAVERSPRMSGIGSSLTVVSTPLPRTDRSPNCVLLCSVRPTGSDGHVVSSALAGRAPHAEHDEGTDRDQTSPDAGQRQRGGVAGGERSASVEQAGHEALVDRINHLSPNWRPETTLG